MEGEKGGDKKRIFLRCRPLNTREKVEGSPSCVNINAEEGLIEIKHEKEIC